MSSGNVKSNNDKREGGIIINPQPVNRLDNGDYNVVMRFLCDKTKNSHRKNPNENRDDINDWEIVSHKKYRPERPTRKNRPGPLNVINNDATLLKVAQIMLFLFLSSLAPEITKEDVIQYLEAPSEGKLSETALLRDPKSNTPKQLRILNINVRSLENISRKLLQLKSFIDDKNLDVLSVTGHWMSEEQIGALCINGYNTLSFSARKDSAGGGTAIFVRDGLKASKRNFRIDYNMEKNIEYACVLVENFNVHVVVMYRIISNRTF
ncbi:hypothetical protein WA026_019949 [Henosepilachna vigintioctopunctata]|uniref:Uncharacterized protein n=1 Tax=Henosepilachna vigintioctopunctata TaxID=420089 RepID=A0AAW1V569_9CUCU